MPHEEAPRTRGQRFEITLLGMPIAFWATADAGRVEAAKQLIEDHYDELKSHARHVSAEQLLRILLIGIADGMLQTQQETDDRVRALLSRIEEWEKSAR